MSLCHRIKLHVNVECAKKRGTAAHNTSRQATKRQTRREQIRSNEGRTQKRREILPLERGGGEGRSLYRALVHLNKRSDSTRCMYMYKFRAANRRQQARSTKQWHRNNDRTEQDPLFVLCHATCVGQGRQTAWSTSYGGIWPMTITKINKYIYL